MEDREKFIIICCTGIHIASEAYHEEGMSEKEVKERLYAYLVDLCKHYGINFDAKLFDEIAMFMTDLSLFCRTDMEGDFSV